MSPLCPWRFQVQGTMFQQEAGGSEEGIFLISPSLEVLGLGSYMALVICAYAFNYYAFNF